MPAASRWMIRLSLLYLVTGIMLGALLLVNKAYPLHPAVWMVLPAHIELTIFGWIIQLTLGTAYWMLPRFLEGPSRGNRALVVGMVTSWNMGILLVIADTLISTMIPLRLVGRSLECLAVVLFVALHWNRITTYNR